MPGILTYNTHLSAISEYQPVWGDTPDVLLFENANLPYGITKVFRKSELKESYTDLDTVVAKYTNNDYLLDDWPLGSISGVAVSPTYLTTTSGENITTQSGEKLATIETAMYTPQPEYLVTDIFGERITTQSGEMLITIESAANIPIPEQVFVTTISGERMVTQSGEMIITIESKYVPEPESLILVRDNTDTAFFKWKLVRGFDPNYTVMYTLQGEYTFENICEWWDLSPDCNPHPFRIGQTPINDTSAWVPALESFDPIRRTIYMFDIDPEPVDPELPIINNSDIILVPDSSSLAHFRIDASNMDESYMDDVLPESTIKYKIEEIGSESKISKNVFVDHTTGLVFANKLQPGRTTLKISATNKFGTASKIVNVVVGSYNEGPTYFNTVSSNYYPVSSIFASPEIDHVVTAEIEWFVTLNNNPSRRTIDLKFANRKPTSTSENFYFTTYIPVGSDRDLGLLTDVPDGERTSILEEIPKGSVGEVPFIRRFSSPIEFGPNRQQMHWGIIAGETSNLNRDNPSWTSDVIQTPGEFPESVAYLYVNPLSSSTIPTTNWYKVSSSDIAFVYEPSIGLYPTRVLSAFYSSNGHELIYGDLSTASLLVSANDLTITSEYYAYSKELFAYVDGNAETVSSARVKVNTDVDLIDNYEPFEYTNNYIIEEKTKEYNDIITNFWANYSKIVSKQFITPNPPSLNIKYTSETISHTYKPHELLAYKANILKSINNTNLTLNYVILIDGKVWLTVEPPILDAPVFLVNAGYPIPSGEQQTATFNSYNSLPKGENRLRKVYWSGSNNTNAFPRIVGNKDGIGHFGPLSAKCYWGIQTDELNFSAVNPNVGNLDSFEFPKSGWLATSDRSLFNEVSQYNDLAFAPPLVANSELKPKFFYASVNALPLYNQNGILTEHGSALVFRGKITPGDFKAYLNYINKATLYNKQYISSNPAVAYGTELRFGLEQVGALRKLGYL